MANVQLPGFIPYTKGGHTTELVRKRVLTNNSTAIFKGDWCDSVTTGDVIVNASATVDGYGVMWGGASYMSSGQRIERKYLPAATTYSGSTVDPVTSSYVYIVDDNITQKFKASIDEAVVLDRLGENFRVVLGTGSTSSGLSGHELDATSPGTTATQPFRVIDFAPIDGVMFKDIDATDAHVICLVNAGNREPALEPGGSLGT